MAQLGRTLALREALATRRLPAVPGRIPEDIQAWLESLPMLAERCYSIANSNSGSGIELVVRLVENRNGWGLVSGRLVKSAAIGEYLAIRLRANPGFRADAISVAAPAIFIGSGTGIAGLRGHLQARIEAGRYANWLIFGERYRCDNFYFQDEIEAWHATGRLSYLDLAFSRDGATKKYVHSV